MEKLEKLEQLKSLLLEEVEVKGKKYSLVEELEKFYLSENKTAGTRARKLLQEIKNLSHEMRKDVQDFKNKLNS